MVNGNDNQHSAAKTLKLVYIIGRYPELTTTFIEREIKTLRQLGDIQIQVVSIRYPLTLSSALPEYQEILDSTLYLIPEGWLAFNWVAFIVANLRFIFLRPLVYFGTLIYLLSHAHPSLRDRLMTILHFWQGVYAAHLLSSQEFDHLHAHFIDRAVVVALVVSRLLGKSYSLTAHANSIFTKKILIREKIVNARFMVTVSRYNKTYLLDNYPGLNPEKIHVLHPWVNLSSFVPPPTRPVSEHFRILSVGRLVEKKGHHDLIEACRLLKERGLDFECQVAGNGPLMSQLVKLVAQHNLNGRVRLLGGQPQSKVVQLLSSWADVFVLPCVIAKDGDRDGIPVSLAEAMATELPVISTDIVGISELVQPGTGSLVPPHDPAALAEALQAIHAAGTSARVEMGSRGRAVVDAEFNLLKGTAQLATLFRENIA
jgi:colanic acid/amylovoran biosynthesis glycosyltransferase